MGSCRLSSLTSVAHPTGLKWNALAVLSGLSPSSCDQKASLGIAFSWAWQGCLGFSAIHKHFKKASSCVMCANTLLAKVKLKFKPGVKWPGVDSASLRDKLESHMANGMTL